MPELPSITVYLECLEPRILGQPLEGVRLQSVSVLRTVEPSLDATAGRTVTSLRRVGKRIAIGLEGDEDGEEIFLLLHLMIAGRLRWRPRGAKGPAKRCHAVFDFPTGSLLFTEASSKKRAMLHVLRGEDALAEHDPGGLEIADATLDDCIAEVRSPVFVVHGRHDAIFKAAQAERIAAALPDHGTLWMVEDGVHCCHNRAFEVRTGMVDWLVERL